MGSPVISTLLKAVINEHFIGFPGLDKTLIKKHLIPKIATENRHMRKKLSGLQSTKTPMYDTKTTYVTSKLISIV